MPGRNFTFTAILALCSLVLGCGASEQNSSGTHPRQGESSDGSKVSPAEQLFRDFEAKILSAKVVRVSGTSVSQGGKIAGETRSSFLSGPHNQVRMTVVVKSSERDPNVGLISDGSKLNKITGEGRKGAEMYFSKELGQGLRHGFTRVGFNVIPFALKDEFRFELQHLAAWFPVGDFSLLRDEEINGRKARLLQFSSGQRNAKVLFTLYLDAETHRPLKRLWEAGDGSIVTETYDEFELDGPVEDKEFHLAD